MGSGVPRKPQLEADRPASLGPPYPPGGHQGGSGTHPEGEIAGARSKERSRWGEGLPSILCPAPTPGPVPNKSPERWMTPTSTGPHRPRRPTRARQVREGGRQSPGLWPCREPHRGRGQQRAGSAPGDRPHLPARTCRTCPPPPPAPARTPEALLTCALPGPAPSRDSPRPAPLHALSPPSAPPAARGRPPPAPSRRRPLRGHNGAAAAPLMHMHDVARPAPPPRPEQPSLELPPERRHLQAPGGPEWRGRLR